MPFPQPTAPSRRAAIALFYASHAAHIERLVARHATAPSPVIEDACSNAWTILLRRDDIDLDASGRAWLVRVAIHEAWRLAAREQSTPITPNDAEQLAALAVAAPDDPTAAVLARAQHAERVADLQALKPREQRELVLHAAGFSHKEIADITDSTYTAVNRRIAEGRAQLRRTNQRRSADHVEESDPATA